MIQEEVIPREERFVPKLSVAWLIGVQKYDRVRGAPVDPKPNCLDLDQVPEDIARMADFFEYLNFDQVIKT